MTDEIRSRLARLDRLSVMSRASARHYRGRAVPAMAQLREELGVEYALVGIVNWQASDTGPSDVRVTAEVIDVTEDTVLWTDSFQAALADPFAVQSRIATEVTDVLGLALAETERAELLARPTDNLEAHTQYLKGNLYLNRAREVIAPGDTYFAIEFLDRAVELDPGFALAQARLSVAHSWLWEQYEDRTVARLALARDAADTAYQLAPTLPDARYARGLVFLAEGRKTLARDEFEALLATQPSNAEAHEALSFLQRDLGDWHASNESMARAAELSPRDGRLHCWAGGGSFGLREFDDAIDYHLRAIALRPDRACPYVCMINIYVEADGDTAGARAFLDQEIPAEVGRDGRPPIAYARVMLDVLDGDFETALDQLASGEPSVYEFLNYYLPKDLVRAQIRGWMGRPGDGRQDYERARAHLEAALEAQPDDDRMHSALGLAYAGLGLRDEAIAAARRGVEILDLGQEADEGLGFRIRDLAQVLVMVDEHEEAITQLERLLAVPAFFSTGSLAIDPAWAPLRDLPRFQALLEVA